MREKEIDLSLEEIRYLLQGTIHWQDIQEKNQRAQRGSAMTQQRGRSVSPKVQPTLPTAGIGAVEPEPDERYELNQILWGQTQKQGTHGIEGKFVGFLLTAMGVITITTWAYFVFAG